MAKSSRAYKSSKRTKELLRQKKQEEKRQRRLARAANPHQDDGELLPDAETPETEGGETLEPGDETPEPGDETPPESA